MLEVLSLYVCLMGHEDANRENFSLNPFLRLLVSCQCKLCNMRDKCLIFSLGFTSRQLESTYLSFMNQHWHIFLLYPPRS